MYRAVTETTEIRSYLANQPLVAFDIETAPDEP